MPRASWKGFLRLSLVSCPVYLSPATTRTKSVRLHQLWVPRERPAEGADSNTDEAMPQVGHRRETEQPPEEAEAEPPATRIALRPHDPDTGAEVERGEVIKGYEYQRGQFVTCVFR